VKQVNPETKVYAVQSYAFLDSLMFVALADSFAFTNIMSSDFFSLPNPSSRTMALRSTQPLTEMSTRNLPGGKGRPERKADNFTAICEPIV
jgi:hypothetical protein